MDDGTKNLRAGMVMLAFAGAVCVSIGLYLAWPPLGFIGFGAWLMFVSFVAWMEEFQPQ